MKRIVVIGNGMAGYKFCEKFVSYMNEISKPDEYEISIIGEEKYLAYNRVNLSNFLANEQVDDLSLASIEWYHSKNIHVKLNERIVEINREEKYITSDKNYTYPYDYLVLATGSAPFVPNIPGVDQEGVFVYRTIDDLIHIKNFAVRCSKGLVIGGGLLGLEAAKALNDLGLERVNIVELQTRLMPRQIDDLGSAILENELRKKSFKILKGKHAIGIEKNKSLIVKFQDNTCLETDMVVFSAGIRPRDELARKAGLKVAPKGGIIVNEYMVTSDPSIYAIGECASYHNVIYGLVAPCFEMADVAACHILGTTQKRFIGSEPATKLKFKGVNVASIGDPFVSTNDASIIVYYNHAKNIYKKLCITKDSKYLLGAILIGDCDKYNELMEYYRQRIPLPTKPETLIYTNDGTEVILTQKTQLPDTALICTCNSVTKAAIRDAIKNANLKTVEELKLNTSAGTGCGGCIGVVKDILTQTLKEMGITQQSKLCEHFSYTRQQLIDLIRFHKIKTFDEAISRFGQGMGCEICKPAIASILASVWNEMILRREHAKLQDTNDKFLANLQKGGTYSIVPRIPGGEITPEKLITLGQIAKKYNLYTKITGGQRIDMFGARVDQLPEIWEELVKAGFESGHAYAKAIRTVKSCVGSTWCRFGVQDSVSMAIRIEERYKGIRAPHKIKAAVSGCTRECAEAQGKDFGLIATEKGYNLYVCGNGGMKPQHAVLLAQDLDEETCIKYIDRFIAFYIRTADPLTRTSVWLNKMEGGIDYLRDVIINDSLGICKELENEIQQLISSYQCEWKAVVNDPELKKRFRHFLNTNEPDPTIKWKSERGQKIPHAW